MKLLDVEVIEVGLASCREVDLQRLQGESAPKDLHGRGLNFGGVCLRCRWCLLLAVVLALVAGGLGACRVGR